jgi:hypothetical protein
MQLDRSQIGSNSRMSRPDDDTPCPHSHHHNHHRPPDRQATTQKLVTRAVSSEWCTLRCLAPHLHVLEEGEEE